MSNKSTLDTLQLGILNTLLQLDSKEPMGQFTIKQVYQTCQDFDDLSAVGKSCLSLYRECYVDRVMIEGSLHYWITEDGRVLLQTPVLTEATQTSFNPTPNLFSQFANKISLVKSQTVKVNPKDDPDNPGNNIVEVDDFDHDEDDSINLDLVVVSEQPLFPENKLSKETLDIMRTGRVLTPEEDEIYSYEENGVFYIIDMDFLMQHAIRFCKLTKACHVAREKARQMEDGSLVVLQVVGNNFAGAQKVNLKVA